MFSPFHRLIGEGYRVFFLAAGLYAIFSVGIWALWLGGQAAGAQDWGGIIPNLAPDVPPRLWHAHEMVFGYSMAAIGGFFLTAVPNWTGAKAARHLFIGAAAGLWLAGRVAVWFSGDLGPGLVALVDLAFLPLLAAKILTQLLRRPKPQNMMFLGLLAILWVGNLMVHLEWMAITQDTLATGLRVGIFGTCALIAVLGGRVTPAFTRNAMIRTGRETGLPVSRKPIELAAISLAIVLPLAVFAGLPDKVTGTLALAAGVAQLLRLAGWRTGWALRQPILAALHLALGVQGLGLLLTGLAGFGIGTEVAALHVLGIGAIGGMTMAVMSRAALGHSGRPLIAPKPLACAYALISLAAALRWGTAELGFGGYYLGLLTAAGVWITAFALYVITLWPVFWGSREARPVTTAK